MKITAKKVSKKNKERQVNSVTNGKTLKEYFQSKNMSDKEKAKFYKELKVLLKSGVTIEDAVMILLENTKKKSIKTIYSLIYDELLKGKSLVFSIKNTNRFTNFEVSTIAIGEETKGLVKVLEELEMFFEKRYKLKSQIKTILTYPTFVIVITIAVLVFMLNNVVPMFEKVFKQFDSELPYLTKQIINISQNFHIINIVFLVIVALIIIAYSKFKDKDWFRELTSKIVLKLPFVGKLVQIIYLSRFCRGLSMLLYSKVPLVKALEFVRQMVDFYPIESSISKIREDIIKGHSFGDSLKKHSVYDTNLVSMIRVSEKVNELEDMFHYLSNIYADEIEEKSKRIGSLIEPIIIIIIGALVGVIMISMYLPMFNLTKIIGN